MPASHRCPRRPTVPSAARKRAAREPRNPIWRAGGAALSMAAIGRISARPQGAPIPAVQTAFAISCKLSFVITTTSGIHE